MDKISISLADVSLRLTNKKTTYDWVRTIVRTEGLRCGDIAIILCSDGFLLDMNKKFLKHNYYTDIITFDYSESKLISGELYISIDRVKENAAMFNVAFLDELYRVMAHGVLHLCGYGDKTDQESKRMRLKENQKLKLLR